MIISGFSTMTASCLLIANRGEIACRIIRTCRRLGIRAVAVYSDADANALHVRQAGAAVRIGPASPLQSYLNVDAVLNAARRAGVEAIHPGVGFLAENADFAHACVAARLTFIGPSAAAIALMADKRAGRAHAVAAGVPVIPGYDGRDQSDEALRQAAEQLGFPLLIKAAAGGGGKGMRLVASRGEFQEGLAATRREAEQAFGSGDLLLEQALLRPRHIEVQVLGDRHGNLLHLGERDCSLQRRHQKVIEETPSPGLNREQREAICEAAVVIARAAGYDNAGTVEFLLDGDGRFYFLEMNTRLQVEHPLTELVTDLDLVEWQIRIATGERLPWRQADIQPQGNAIEARLYAEDPANDYLPVTGRVALWRPPEGEGLRVDSGIQSGDEMAIHYDPLLAKIIAYGPDRQAAVQRLQRALEQTTLLGLTTNLPFLADVLEHPAFAAGELSTGFLAEHFGAWRPSVEATTPALIAVTLAQWYSHPQHPTNRGYWRNNPNGPTLYRFRLPASADTGKVVEVRLQPLPRTADQFEVSLSTDPEIMYAVSVNEQTGHEIVLTIDGYRQQVTLIRQGNNWWLKTRAGVAIVEALPRFAEPAQTADASGSLRAPMPGSVSAVLVEVGQPVEVGQSLMKLEAMKMEHTIRAAVAGVVEAIHYTPGDQVEADALLVSIGRLDDYHLGGDNHLE